MLKYIVLVLLSALQFGPSFAEERISARSELALKIGPTVGVSHVKARNNTENTHPAAGFMTQLSYQWGRFEFSASSYMLIAGINNLDFKTREFEFNDSSGRYRNIAITPTLKYFPKFASGSVYHFYIGAGPQLSHRTMTLRRSEIEGGDLRLDQHKVNYEARGLLVQLGVEQLRTESRKNPMYVEVALVHSQTRNARLIESENFRKTEILDKRQAVGELKYFKLLFTVGYTLF